jgi:hypothetical protein
MMTISTCWQMALSSGRILKVHAARLRDRRGARDLNLVRLALAHPAGRSALDWRFVSGGARIYVSL